MSKRRLSSTSLSFFPSTPPLPKRTQTSSSRILKLMPTSRDPPRIDVSGESTGQRKKGKEKDDDTNNDTIYVGGKEYCATLGQDPPAPEDVEEAREQIMGSSASKRVSESVPKKKKRGRKTDQPQKAEKKDKKDKGKTKAVIEPKKLRDQSPIPRVKFPSPNAYKNTIGTVTDEFFQQVVDRAEGLKARPRMQRAYSDTGSKWVHIESRNMRKGGDGSESRDFYFKTFEGPAEVMRIEVEALAWEKKNSSDVVTDFIWVDEEDCEKTSIKAGAWKVKQDKGKGKAY